MSNHETPSHAAAYVLGMTVEAFENMCDREADFAAEVEFGQINIDQDNPRFLTEWDLSDDQDEPEEVAAINAFLDSQNEYVMNRLN